MPDTDPSAILVVGSVAFDNIQTPTCRVERVLGGSASYAAIASSYFAPTRLVGVVGSDFGDDCIERFSRRGIDLAGLQRDQSGKTFFWDGRYEDNFKRCTTIDIKLNVFESFMPRLPESYRKTPYVMLGNIHPKLQLHVLDQMERRAFVVADTRDLWIETTRPELLKLLPRIDMLVLSDDEAPILTGEQNLIRAGKALLKMGPGMVIIKKGQHGSALFHGDKLFVFPAYPVEEVRDPTGAGDSYAGALVGYLAASLDTSLPRLKRAIACATATASLTVEDFGPRGLEIGGREEIDRRYHTLLDISRME